MRPTTFAVAFTLSLACTPASASLLFHGGAAAGDICAGPAHFTGGEHFTAFAYFRANSWGTIGGTYGGAGNIFRLADDSVNSAARSRMGFAGPKLFFGVGGSDGSAGQWWSEYYEDEYEPVHLGQWHSYAVSFSFAAITDQPRMYIDGYEVEVEQVTAATGSFPADGQRFSIGNRTALDRSLDGYLLRAAYWDRILSPGEILRATIFGPAAVPVGLIMELGDDGSDLSGHGNGCALAGASVSSEAPVAEGIFATP